MFHLHCGQWAVWRDQRNWPPGELQMAAARSIGRSTGCRARLTSELAHEASPLGSFGRNPCFARRASHYHSGLLFLWPADGASSSSPWQQFSKSISNSFMQSHSARRARRAIRHLCVPESVCNTGSLAQADGRRPGFARSVARSSRAKSITIIAYGPLRRGRARECQGEGDHCVASKASLCTQLRTHTHTHTHKWSCHAHYERRLISPRQFGRLSRGSSLRERSISIGRNSHRRETKAVTQRARCCCALAQGRRAICGRCRRLANTLSEFESS